MTRRLLQALTGGTLAGLALTVLVTRPGAAAETVGQVSILPSPPGPHWVWVGDVLLRRSALVDADSGRFLGLVSGGVAIIAPHVSPDRRELYVAETHYARGTRGERTDVVTIRDAASLAPRGEVVIPPRRAELRSWVAASALSDDGQFLAVFNLTPATSLSIVDVAARRFATEVDYTLNCMGCHLADGSGAPGRVPALAGSIGRFLSVPGGRAYLVRVPGVAQAPLSDAATAALLNWLVRTFDPEALPPSFVPYSAAEVGALRAQPLTDVAAARRALLERGLTPPRWSVAPPRPHARGRGGSTP